MNRKSKKAAPAETLYEIFITGPYDDDDGTWTDLIYSTTNVENVQTFRRAFDHREELFSAWSMVAKVNGVAFEIPAEEPDSFGTPWPALGSPEAEARLEADADGWDRSQADELTIFEIVFLDDDGKFAGILCRDTNLYATVLDLVNEQLPYGKFGVRDRHATLNPMPKVQSSLRKAVAS